MNAAYIAAGALFVLGAAIHGGVGEATVVRKLDTHALPRTRWGGPRITLAHIRVAWHMVTAAFLAFGAALSVCGARAQSDACTGIGVLAAVSSAAFAVIVLAGASTRSPRLLVRHPAPLLLSAVAVLSWIGARA